ncbi:MAG: hypothetical protein WC370_10825 [Dehalococcoidales bacterium]
MITTEEKNLISETASDNNLARLSITALITHKMNIAAQSPTVT